MALPLRPVPARPRLLLAANVVVLAALACAAAGVGAFERAARHAVYGGHVRVAEQTGVQEVVLTGGGPRGLPAALRRRPARGLRPDEARYHEALVEPAMDGPHARVLVLGGGDGLALREVLRYPACGR